MKAKDFYDIENDNLGSRMKNFSRKELLSLKELHNKKKYYIEKKVVLKIKKNLAQKIYGNKEAPEESPGF